MVWARGGAGDQASGEAAVGKRGEMKRRTEILSEEEFEEVKPSKWKSGVSSFFLLEDLFSREEKGEGEPPGFEDDVEWKPGDPTPEFDEVVTACDVMCVVTALHSCHSSPSREDDNYVDGRYFHPVGAAGKLKCSAFTGRTNRWEMTWREKCMMA